MTDFDQIYPELLEKVRFPKFTKDYTEVIYWLVLIRTINTVCIYMFIYIYIYMLLEEFVHTFILIEVILNIREYKKKIEKVFEVIKMESI